MTLRPSAPIWRDWCRCCRAAGTNVASEHHSGIALVIAGLHLPASTRGSRSMLRTFLRGAILSTTDRGPGSPAEAREARTTTASGVAALWPIVGRT